MAIGESGAKNAALTALRILAIEDAALAEKLEKLPSNKAKLRRHQLMNSTKTIGIIGGGQLGQMMLFQLSIWDTRWLHLIQRKIVLHLVLVI